MTKGLHQKLAATWEKKEHLMPKVNLDTFIKAMEEQLRSGMEEDVRWNLHLSHEGGVDDENIEFKDISPLWFDFQDVTEPIVYCWS